MLLHKTYWNDAGETQKKILLSTLFYRNRKETVGYQAVQSLLQEVLITFIGFNCTVHLKELKGAF